MQIKTSIAHWQESPDIKKPKSKKILVTIIVVIIALVANLCGERNVYVNSMCLSADQI